MSLQERVMLPLSQWLLVAVLACISIGSLVVLHVEADRKHIEAEQFRQATTYAKVGRWFWDIRTNELRWDHTMFDLYGITSPDWSPDFDGFFKQVDPRDRGVVQERINKAIETRSGYSAVFRVVSHEPDNPRYILSGAYVSPDGSYMTGINVRITHENLQGLRRVLHANDTAAVFNP